MEKEKQPHGKDDRHDDLEVPQENAEEVKGGGGGQWSGTAKKASLKQK